MTANLTLTYGALNLTASPYMIPFGTDTGAPQNATEALAFLLLDGEIELSSRASNRTLQFDVIIEGASLTALATAEANLVAETEKPLNTLTIDPGDSAPATVYETYRAQVTFNRDDNWELGRMRRYQVTVRAMPFGRSTTETVATALAATGATTTLLDACAAATGWSGTIDGGAVTPTSAGGSVLVTGTVTAKASHSFSLQKTFAATTSSTNLLQVDWLKPTASVGITDSFASRLRATGDGVALELVAEAPSPTSGYTRTWFKVAAATLALTRFDWSGYFPTGGSQQLAVDNVSVTNVNPIIGNARQSLRSITVGGSARAPGTLVINNSSTPLGDVLLYVYDADRASVGYVPSLRPLRSSGNTVTTDTTRVSGASEPLNGSAVVFDVPIGIFPRGTYILMARMMTAAGGTPTITYTSTTVLGSNTIGTSNGTATVTLTSTYQNFALAKLVLPTTDLGPDSSAALMRLSLQASTACTYDDVWLYNVTIGALVQVTCGTNAVTGGRRLFIDSPSVNDPRPTVRISTSSVTTVADRGGAFYPAGSVLAWQVAEFNPPQANVHLVASNSTDAAINLVYYKRWHTNAAE